MKKPTAVQIAIPEPCTQAWEDMQPIAGGRHCAHCQRVVVDFTRMTDAQLLEYFSKGNTSCGRFAAEQLDRVIQPVDILQSNWWTRIAADCCWPWGFQKKFRRKTEKNQRQWNRFQHPLFIH